MRTEQLPWYMLLAPIVGFDESGDDDADDADDDADDADDDDDADDEDEEDAEKGSKKPKVDPKDDEIANLRKALRAERKNHRRTTKEKTALEREKSTKDGKDDKESETAIRERDELRGKNQKLADRLRDTAVDGAIVRLATKMKFRDLDDAIALVNRDDFDIDQDEDDPSDIDIDEKSIEAALKQLAEKKPHLLVADGEDEVSGSKFGGKKQKDKDGLTDDILKERYPALSR